MEKLTRIESFNQLADKYVYIHISSRQIVIVLKDEHDGCEKISSKNPGGNSGAIYHVLSNIYKTIKNPKISSTETGRIISLYENPITAMEVPKHIAGIGEP